MFFRFVYTILKEKIHKSLIVNMNQTRVILILEANDHTNKKKKAKQILIHGKNKKCAFTAVLSTSQTDKVLPIQSVWKRANLRSLSTKLACAEAQAARYRFAFNKNTH